jgi:hypothetical protein
LKSGKHRSSGQAIVELVVALVVILVLFASIIQVSLLGVHQSWTMGEARKLAGVKAMSAASSFESPRFIEACTVGRDGVAFTRDDDVTVEAPSVFTTGLAGYAHPTELNKIRPDNPVSVLAGSDMPQAMFGLVQGEKTDTVKLMPIISQLIYGADAVEVRGSAWLTWTKGIY